MRKDGFTYENGRVLTCNALSATGLVFHGFSTKKEGTSSGPFASLNLGIHTRDDREKVKQNFALFCRELAIDPKTLVLSQQVHGTVVREAGRKDCGKGLYRDSDFLGVDGLVTNEPGVALATFYADCTPILLLDPVRRVIASVHSGWRGTVAGIVQQAVLLMQQRYHCCSQDILVAMGPSIKQCHFEVDEDVYLLFLQRFGEKAKACTRQKNEKYYIDTDSLNKHLLLEMGLLQEHIHICESCTYCHQSLFFSHMREGETGRMCAVIALQ